MDPVTLEHCIEVGTDDSVATLRSFRRRRLER